MTSPTFDNNSLPEWCSSYMDQLANADGEVELKGGDTIEIRFSDSFALEYRLPDELPAPIDDGEDVLLFTVDDEALKLVVPYAHPKLRLVSRKEPLKVVDDAWLFIKEDWLEEHYSWLRKEKEPFTKFSWSDVGFKSNRGQIDLYFRMERIGAALFVTAPTLFADPQYRQEVKRA